MPNSAPKLRAAPRWIASRVRRDGGSSSAARSRRLSSSRIRWRDSRYWREASTRRGCPARLAARGSSTRSSADDARRGHLRSHLRSATVSASTMTSLTIAEVSRYATSPFFGTHLLKHLRQQRLAPDGEAGLERKDVAHGSRRQSLVDHLIQHALAGWAHDAGHRPTTPGYVARPALAR